MAPQISRLDQPWHMGQGIAGIHPGETGKEKRATPVKTDPESRNKPQGQPQGKPGNQQAGGQGKEPHIETHIEGQQNEGRNGQIGRQTAVPSKDNNNPVEQQQKMKKTGQQATESSVGHGRAAVARAGEGGSATLPPGSRPHDRQQKGEQGNKEQRPETAAAGKGQPEQARGQQWHREPLAKGKSCARHGPGIRPLHRSTG